MKITTGQEYAAKIINTKKLSARGGYIPTECLRCLLLISCILVASVKTDHKIIRIKVINFLSSFFFVSFQAVVIFMLNVSEVWRSVTVAILCLKGSFMKSFKLVHPLPIFILEKNLNVSLAN